MGIFDTIGDLFFGGEQAQAGAAAAEFDPRDVTSNLGGATFDEGGNLSLGANEQFLGPLLALMMGGGGQALGSLGGNLSQLIPPELLQAFQQSNAEGSGFLDNLGQLGQTTFGGAQRGFDAVQNFDSGAFFDERFGDLTARDRPGELRGINDLQDMLFSSRGSLGGDQGTLGGPQRLQAAEALSRADIGRRLAASGETRAEQGRLFGEASGQAGLFSNLFGQQQDAASSRFGRATSLFDQAQGQQQFGANLFGQGQQGIGQLFNLLLQQGNLGSNLGANASQAALGGQQLIADSNRQTSGFFGGLLNDLLSNVPGLG
jgi:hypothetical protein